MALFFLTSCKKNEEITPNPPTKETTPLHGKVELPNSVSHSEIKVCNLLQIEELNTSNEFDFDQTNTLFAVNSSNRLLFVGYPSTDESNEYILNAKETALFMVMRVIPFSLSKENQKIVDDLKTVLYANVKSIKKLEGKISESIITHGYVEPEDFQNEWNIALTETIGLFGLDKVNPLKNRFATGDTYAMQVTYPEDNNYQGDVHNDNGSWRLKRDFYSKYQAYLALAIGDYQEILNSGTATDSEIIGYIRPYNMGAFLDGITNVETWQQYFQDLFETLVHDINHNPTWDAQKTTLSFDVNAPDKDAMVFITPKNNDQVRLYNIAHIILDVFTGMLAEGDIINDFVQEVLITSNDLGEEIIAAFENKNFVEASNLLIPEFKNFIQQKIKEDILQVISDGFLDDYLFGAERFVIEKMGNTTGFFMELFSTDNFFIPIDFEGKNPPNQPTLKKPSHLVQLNNVSSVTLEWEGSDSDNDNLTYDIYFGTSLDDFNLHAENKAETSLFIGVSPNTQYIWKVVIKDGTYETKGPIWSFMNGEVYQTGVLIDDRDGQIYNWVQLGDQKWMSENLDYDTNDSYCYENQNNNCDLTGRLYNPSTSLSVCPVGWHVPSKSELEQLYSNYSYHDLVLTNYLGFNFPLGGWYGSTANSFQNYDEIGFLLSNELSSDQSLVYALQFLGNNSIMQQGDFTSQIYMSCRCVEGIIDEENNGSANLSIDFVFIEGGTFEMGCTSEQGTDCINDESPIHEVTISDFSISKYEITNAQYAQFLNEQGNQFEGGANWYFSSGADIQFSNEEYNPVPGKENHPVTDVTWYGARAFTTWVGGRLSSEAEWEFVARGGNLSNGYKFSGSDNIEEVGWNGLDNISDVGLKMSNELGVYDMTGNAREWCQDWYEESYYNSSPMTNPSGPSSGMHKVMRGGNVGFGESLCRNSKRLFQYPNFTGNSSSSGFRVAK